MSKKSPKQKQPKENYQIGGMLGLTCVRAGSWLCVAWVCGAVEVLSALIALLAFQETLSGRIALILYGAKAVDMFCFMTWTFMETCEHYGYDNPSRRGLHPLHREIVKMRNLIRSTLGERWTLILGLVLIVIPTGILTVAALFYGEKTAYTPISRIFTVIQISQLIVLYVLRFADWCTYRILRKTEPRITFRMFVAACDNQR